MATNIFVPPSIFAESPEEMQQALSIQEAQQQAILSKGDPIVEGARLAGYFLSQGIARRRGIVDPRVQRQERAANIRRHAIRKLQESGTPITEYTLATAAQGVALQLGYDREAFEISRWVRDHENHAASVAANSRRLDLMQENIEASERQTAAQQEGANARTAATNKTNLKIAELRAETQKSIQRMATAAKDQKEAHKKDAIAKFHALYDLSTNMTAEEKKHKKAAAEAIISLQALSGAQSSAPESPLMQMLQTVSATLAAEQAQKAGTGLTDDAGNIVSDMDAINKMLDDAYQEEVAAANVEEYKTTYKSAYDEATRRVNELQSAVNSLQEDPGDKTRQKKVVDQMNWANATQFDQPDLGKKFQAAFGRNPLADLQSLYTKALVAAREQKKVREVQPMRDEIDNYRRDLEQAPDFSDPFGA